MLLQPFSTCGMHAARIVSCAWLLVCADMRIVCGLFFIRCGRGFFSVLLHGDACRFLVGLGVGVVRVFLRSASVAFVCGLLFAFGAIVPLVCSCVFRWLVQPCLSAASPLCDGFVRLQSAACVRDPLFVCLLRCSLVFRDAILFFVCFLRVLFRWQQ